MEYEGDDAKAVANFRKHGVSFTAAAHALDDPQKIELLDDRFEYGEERVLSLCMGSGAVLFVVSAMRTENTCRIISARKAIRHEQEKYFQGGSLLP